MEKIICLRFTDIFQGREDVRMELEKKRGDTYRKELEENEELKRQLTAKNRCDHNKKVLIKMENLLSSTDFTDSPDFNIFPQISPGFTNSTQIATYFTRFQHLKSKRRLGDSKIGIPDSGSSVIS